jgi:hypothetical protein
MYELVLSYFDVNAVALTRTGRVDRGSCTSIMPGMKNSRASIVESLNIIRYSPGRSSERVVTGAGHDRRRSGADLINGTMARLRLSYCAVAALGSVKKNVEP